MELTGLRWRYQIGNSTIDVDNAVGGSLWSQERLVVNGEPLYGGGGRLRFLQRFREPWLTPDGEREIRVTLSPGVGVVRCRLSLDGLRLDPLEILHARWYGDRGTWPTEDAWLR